MFVVIGKHDKLIHVIEHDAVAKWLTLSPVVVEARFRVPARVTFHLTFNFFMNDHSKC